MKDPDFKLHGYFDFITKAEGFGSRLIINQRGPINIDFENKNGIPGRITYNMPTIKLNNASSEENRSSIWIESMVFVDTVNNLKGVIKFAYNKQNINAIEGFILEHMYEKDYKYDVLKEIKFGNDLKIDTKNIKQKIFARASGSWLKELNFDNKSYWDIDKHIPGFIRPVNNVIPSDWRFREDLIWLFRSFLSKNEQDRKTFEDTAQNWKTVIETCQRTEREIRKKYKQKNNIK